MENHFAMEIPLQSQDRCFPKTKKALRAGRVQSLICQLALLELAPVPSEWLLQLPWANPSAALDE
jgi:hypothetical protein